MKIALSLRQNKLQALDLNMVLRKAALATHKFTLAKNSCRLH